jgi:hypothetical protein
MVALSGDLFGDYEFSQTGENIVISLKQLLLATRG